MTPKFQRRKFAAVFLWVLWCQTPGSFNEISASFDNGHGDTVDAATRDEARKGFEGRRGSNEENGITHPSYREYENVDIFPVDDQHDIYLLNEDSFNFKKRGTPQIWENTLHSEVGKRRKEKSEDFGRKMMTDALSGCRCVSQTCHCKSLRLTTVPTSLPHYITGLDLSNNSISSLPKQSLCAYPSLLILLLEHNKLRHLDNDTFECVARLAYLNLRVNCLETMKDNRTLAFPYGVFKPLSSLLVLKINKNVPRTHSIDYDYPSEQLADLKNLKILYLDGLSNASFGPSFGEMASLRSLVLAGYEEGFCNLSNVEEDAFTYLSQLRSLNISDCKIKGSDFSKNLLEPLTNLFALDISYNPIDAMSHLEEALSGISNSNLSVLVVNDVFSRYQKAVTVTRQVVDKLPRQLRYLEARENCIETLDPDVIEKLPKTLKYINIGNNKFIYGKYFLNLTALENLETLMLNGGGFLRSFPSAFLPRSRQSRLGMFSRLESGKITKENPIEFKLPPKLKYLDISIAGLEYAISRIALSPNNSLRYLNLGSNYFPFFHGPFSGFENLIYMDLSKASIEYFREHFFRGFKSLKHLRLDSNNLGKWLEKKNRKPFSGLINLTMLDLSNTQILRLGRGVFKGLGNVEVLLLDMNKIYFYHNPFTGMNKLRFLSLRDNEINTLPREVRKHIDRLVVRYKFTRVDLSYNPIRCDCGNLEFLRWMVRSDAFDKQFRNYSCHNPDRSVKFIHDKYAETIQVLGRECSENYPMFLTVMAATLAMLVVVFVGVIYRFRWKLRYLYYAAYLRLKSTDQQEQSEQYRYDVFVSYTYKDEQFVLSELMPELRNRGLKLLVHGRDFVVGEFIASNILTAVKESRKLLVVLTRSLLSSEWCRYELQMANQESVQTGRQVLVFLLKESISTRELGAELTYHIRNSTYIMDPRGEGVVEEAVVDQFWNKLAMDLKR